MEVICNSYYRLIPHKMRFWHVTESVKRKKLYKVQMLTRISTNFMSESVTISGDTRGKYFGDFMHRDRGGRNISLVCYIRTQIVELEDENVTFYFFSPQDLYTSLVSLYSGLLLHVILLAFEPFFSIFVNFKVKIIKKRRGERKTVVQSAMP